MNQFDINILERFAIAYGINIKLYENRSLQTIFVNFLVKCRLQIYGNVMLSMTNSYPADFFKNIFHSFEAGIANAISSSK